VKQQLKEAQQRAKASAKALLSELKGSASSTPARYSAWPIGCAVRVALEGQTSEDDSLIASLVNYDSSRNTFEVKLDDGSTRIVPAQRVTRARVRDRASAPVQSKDHCLSSATSAAGGLGASGYQVPPHSQRTQMQRGYISEHPPLAENAPWSPFEPEPQLFGRVDLMS